MGYHILKNNVTRGELTKLVRGRRDLDLYEAGLAHLLNFTVLKQGGFRRRSGTLFLGETAGTVPPRLVPYTFSSDQSYIIEMTPGVARFWTDEGLVLDDVDDPYELVIPYDAAQISRLQFAAFNDVIFLPGAGPIPPKKMTRRDFNDWTIEDFEFRDGPYLPINDIEASKLNTGGALTTGVTRTFTWTQPQSNLVVGRSVRVQINGKWSWCRITAVTSTTVATVEVMRGTGDSSTATASWRLGAYYANNWPSVVSFYDSRLVWANSPSHPRALAVSNSDAPGDYAPTDEEGKVTDSHGMFLDIVAGRADPILWLAEGTGSRLIVGTASAIRTVGSANNGKFTPATADQRAEVPVGCSHVPPVRADSSLILTSRTRRTLHDYHYSLDSNGFIAPDTSVLSEHIPKKRVKKLVWQGAPHNILWGLTDDGNLFGVTVEKAEKVVGFHRHRLDGAFIEDIEVIATPEDDHLWLSTTRTVNGVTKRYMEELHAPFDQDSGDNPYFVDCGAIYSGEPTTTVSGLGHLEGLTVDVVAAGGVVLPRAVVTGGTITLPPGRKPEPWLAIGVPIRAEATSLDPELGLPDGSSMGRRARVASAIVDVTDTVGLYVGAMMGHGEELQYRNTSTAMGAARELLDGAYQVKIDGSTEDGGVINFWITSPTPATVLSFNLNIVSEP